MFASIRDDTLLSAGYTHLLEGLRDLNLSAVELAYSREDSVRALCPVNGKTTFCLAHPAEISAFRDHLHQYGIRVSGLLLANDFNRPDREAEIAWVTRAVESAGALGCPVIRIDAIMSGERDLPLEQRRQIFASAIKAILNRTEGLEVHLGIENHGFQGNDPSFLEGLISAVNSPRLGLTLDTGNFYWRGHPLSRVYRIIETLAVNVKHTHIKNIAYPKEVQEQEREIGWKYGEYVCPIPEGDIDHQRIVNLLKDVGYDWDLCIEDESLGRFPKEQRREILRRDAEYVKRICEGS